MATVFVDCWSLVIIFSCNIAMRFCSFIVFIIIDVMSRYIHVLLCRFIGTNSIK